MADPLTLAAVGALALTEGVKFLYGQAGEVLKRWRERKAAGERPGGSAPVQVVLPADAFDGQLNEPRLHFEAVERLERDLWDLWEAVAGYAQGLREVDSGDRRLLELVDGLRQALEAVYGQRLTFKGEARPASGPVVVGEAKVGEVSGYVAGLRARRVLGGEVVGRAEAGDVGPGGQVIGAEVDTIG
jgi:hypothetical protein